MYFEATRKNYYRFPSASSVNEMDAKYFFPDKPYSSGESSHFDSKVEGKQMHSHSDSLIKDHIQA